MEPRQDTDWRSQSSPFVWYGSDCKVLDRLRINQVSISWAIHQRLPHILYLDKGVLNLTFYLSSVSEEKLRWQRCYWFGSHYVWDVLLEVLCQRAVHLQVPMIVRVAR